MKNAYLILGSLIVMAGAAQNAHATNVILYGSNCHNSYIFDLTETWCGTTVSQACAPEVVDGNLKATDQVLNKLAASPSFAKAELFKSELQRIQALGPDERIAAYFKEVGIDPSNEDQIANFVGERSPQQSNIDALKKNMGLSDAQASQVISSLTQALAGGLQ